MKQLATTYMPKKQANDETSRSLSATNGEGKSRQTEMSKLIKMLNKPEMLLLSHLQNQIKYYP
jgi:hypothetical protein